MMAAPLHRRPRVDGWSDPAFVQVAEVVHLVSGLTFPPNRQPSAESGIRRAMLALRLDSPHALAQAIEVPGEARDAVLAELTVGETYFFREAGQLDILRTAVLPALGDPSAAGETLRVWSAGCASGEEPYTVAILLRELGWTRPARILGTDVALPRLEAARRARYTRWSLRGVSEARVDRWFTRRASHFQLDAEIRDGVEFAPLNLVTGDYPSAATSGQHLVLCRNVLIYFDPASIARIAQRLLDSLAPDGWLVCGASDPPLGGIVPCDVVMTPAGMAYRRAGRDTSAADLPEPGRAVASLAPVGSAPARWIAEPSPAPPIVYDRVAVTPPARQPAQAPPVGPPGADAVPPDDADAVAYAAADYVRAEAMARAALVANPAVVSRWVRLVRSIANQGRLRDADLECVRALDAHRMEAELHYLHAMLLGAAGHHAQAAQAARRALFLDRHFVMAHLQLGASLEHAGDRPGASRAFDNAIAALANVGDDVRIPGADGISASRLRAGAVARRAALGAGSAA